LITLQRHARALGYFSKNKFQQRGDGRAHVHEIALNPDGFVGHSDEEICQTFVHEMAHVWQTEFGHAGRGHYHNREFAAKMHSIGLMASATGKPGGATTGDRMSDYVLEGGPFQGACRAFLDRYRLVWESSSRCEEVAPAGGNGSGSGGDGKLTSPGHEGGKSPTRAKFACPIPKCTETAWAKPSAKLACFAHSKETGELIPMLRVKGTAATTKEVKS
jgi:SprT-like family